MTRHAVCKTDDVVVGKPFTTTIGRAPIFLVRLPSGDISAFSGRCPHQGADLAQGCIIGRVSGESPNQICVDHVGEILRCPWHGFEFDLLTGAAVVQPSTMRLREYSVAIEGGDVVIEA
jgi:nitrite reductase (NADH) small subunit